MKGEGGEGDGLLKDRGPLLTPDNGSTHSSFNSAEAAQHECYIQAQLLASLYCVTTTLVDIISSVYLGLCKCLLHTGLLPW